ncbi:MAG TPA: bleomycin resistance family protein [Acidobacteriota bacterium]|nr:bleomycin resistance family protein [Acidobacteriota bacterium]
MHTKGLTPILNVSDIQQSFDWFQKLGWEKCWDWGDPPTFGAVGSGNSEIFLCLNGQGGRGRGTNTSTFGERGGESADKGVWISIWVDNVDDVYQHCKDRGIEIMFGPEDMPWNVREMHIRHPDGHIFRISEAIEAK